MLEKAGRHHANPGLMVNMQGKRQRETWRGVGMGGYLTPESGKPGVRGSHRITGGIFQNGKVRTGREKLRLEGTQDTVAKCNRGGWTAFKVLLAMHEET